ncbi:hypothetical protein NEOLEDRAFT_974606 [Neolentinus lepideus HHB14362 ss-1]|uniref:Uncharacterized protein n=1 Tax=Neolentinus lepideus HHB14362 ss-1 TaxID=1314782 RepID=A0A165NAI9_9AGAM|nr:hypothetical protein NEOLEDRAFT_974606 [Neolentinus lepideus HHB14362 ss-1]
MRSSRIRPLPTQASRCSRRDDSRSNTEPDHTYHSCRLETPPWYSCPAHLILRVISDGRNLPGHGSSTAPRSRVSTPALIQLSIRRCSKSNRPPLELFSGKQPPPTPNGKISIPLRMDIYTTPT